MSRKKALKILVSRHSRAYEAAEDALSRIGEIFKGLEGFAHCQTGPDGSVEVIVDTGGTVEADWGVMDALDELVKQEVKGGEE